MDAHLQPVRRDSIGYIRAKYGQSAVCAYNAAEGYAVFISAALRVTCVRLKICLVEMLVYPYRLLTHVVVDHRPPKHDIGRTRETFASVQLYRRDHPARFVYGIFISAGLYADISPAVIGQDGLSALFRLPDYIYRQLKLFPRHVMPRPEAAGILCGIHVYLYVSAVCRRLGNAVIKPHLTALMRRKRHPEAAAFGYSVIAHHSVTKGVLRQIREVTQICKAEDAALRVETFYPERLYHLFVLQQAGRGSSVREDQSVTAEIAVMREFAAVSAVDVSPLRLHRMVAPLPYAAAD